MVKQYLVDWTPDQEWAVQDWDRSDAYVVLASDYAALEARCRELEGTLSRVNNCRGADFKRIARLERKVHLACNQFENITVAETLEIAKDRAHRGVAFTMETVVKP